MRALAVLLVLLFAGCLEPSGPTAPTPTTPSQALWHLGGAWTSDHTQGDLDAWCEIAKEYDNECVIMESFPPQYALRFATEALCQEARAKVLALEHITARECIHVEPSDEPDTPTRSPPSGNWSLHGTFRDGFTQDDITAVCRAGTGNDTCAMMKSYPPQYSFTFTSREACEEARAKILAVPHAAPDGCREVPDA